jgi:NTP pyrophosphatase (non-canonical NTP hydrolase)
MENYENDALRTNSDMYFGHNVSQYHFFEILKHCVYYLSELDKIKKTMFYNKQFEYRPFGATCSEFVKSSNDIEGIRLIHSILGIATESGEILEILQGVLNGQKELDKVHFIEEIGDVLWNANLALSVSGSTFSEAKKANIAKLMKRYPEKFSCQNAICRNLFDEREALEGALGSSEKA